jgi:hypothetical protein
LLAGCIWHTADSTLGAFCYLFTSQEYLRTGSW